MYRYSEYLVYGVGGDQKTIALLYSLSLATRDSRERRDDAPAKFSLRVPTIEFGRYKTPWTVYGAMTPSSS